MAQAEHAPTGNQAAGSQPAAPAVDIKKLAEKVYQLMVRDVRLAQLRGDQPRHKRR